MTVGARSAQDPTIASALADLAAATEVYSGPRHRIFRGTSSEGKVVVKMPGSQAPTNGASSSIRHEFELLLDLDLPGVVRVHALTNTYAGFAIRMADVGDSTLHERARSKPFSVGDFLDVAIHLAEIVSRLHARRIVHRDINPTNIVWDTTTDTFTLIDFGIATNLSTLSVDPEAPRQLEGTLAYMSPEQTGRTGHPVDSRTDLYSLGATLYEVATGAPAFTSSDPVELVYAQIARQPPLPHERNPDVPEVLSRIIMKLLEKAPDDRYQTAAALGADLSEAKSQWQTKGVISSLPLARYDVPRELTLSDRLYGRDANLAALEHAFARAAQGTTTFVMLSGPPGIGKSALTRQLAPSVIAARGLFVDGKFDQLQRSEPFSAISKAFSHMVRQLLAEGDATLANWRKRVEAAVAPNAQLLLDLVPELELVIGPQQAVQPLGPVESKNRFELVLTQFLNCASQKSHPLVMVLDDLQWADVASLQLLAQWSDDSSTRYFLLVGAYRDDEVSLSHPLARMLAGLRDVGIAVDDIRLSALKSTDIALLLAKTLDVTVEKVGSLAGLVELKTGGNPFFVRRLLQRLHREGLIRFDTGAAGWMWDVKAIGSTAIAENVLDLLVQAIGTLPPATRDLLETAACIGHRFDLGTLAELNGIESYEATNLLWPALEEQLVVPMGDTYKASRHSVHQGGDPDLLPQWVQFAHDRVQQALYSQLSVERRAGLHLKVGRRLLVGMDASQIDERLFGVVDQLNLGQGILTEPAERLQLAKLNLAAGTKARESGAYQAAAEYFTVALRQLPASSWSSEPDLTFSVYRQLAECDYLVGQHGKAEDIVDTALKHSPSKVATADLYGLRVLAATVAGEWAQALHWGREGLAVFGQEWPLQGLSAANEEEFAVVMPNVGARAIETLVGEAEVADDDLRACMRLLSILGPPAYFSGSEILTFLVTRAANLTLVHGPSPYSAYALAFYAGLHNARTSDYETGYAFGRLALGLARRFGNRAEESRTVEVFGLIVHPWKAPLRESLPLLRDGFRAGVESGELAYAAFNLNSLLINGLPAGVALSDLMADANAAADFAVRHKNRTSLEMVAPFAQLARCLMGMTRSTLTLDDDGFETAKFLEDANANRTALGFYYAAQLQTAYLFGDYDTARRCIKEGLRLVESGNLGMVTMAEFVFFSALSLAADSPVALESQAKNFRKLAQLHKQLEGWEAHAPRNFSHKRMLVAGEIARLNGDTAGALKLFRSAISIASAESFPQDEGLAHELRARLLMEDEPDFATVHLQAAIACYRRWGAVAKVRELESTHPTVLTTWTSHGPNISIDALALIKSSEAIASETTTDGLVEQILAVVAKVAGAQSGALLLYSGEELKVRGRVRFENRVLVTIGNVPLDQTSDLPKTILRTALRLKESVVLSNAASEGEFVRDPVVVGRNLRSVLCVPLTNKNSVVGLIYVENQAFAGAFSPRLVEVMKVLATQAAISLENKELVERLRRLAVDLEKRVEDLRVSDRELRFTLEAGRLGAWTLDLETDQLVTSATCRTNFGRDPDANFTYAELKAAVHPDDRDRMRLAVDHSLRSGVDYDIEYRVIKSDGSVGWVLIRAQPNYGPTGTPMRMTGVSIDITERKTAEMNRLALVELSDAIRDLKNPEDLGYRASEILGKALSVSRVGYATIDPNAETLHVGRDWNAPGVESLAGSLQLRDYGSFIDSLKRGEFIAISDVREDHRTAIAAEALEARNARSFLNVPVIERSRLGAVLYVNHAKVRDWTSAELVLVREVGDRTRMAIQRMRAEQALHFSEESLRLAVGAAEIGTWDLDLTTDVLTWSDRTKAAFGVSPDSSVDMSVFYRGLHPDDLEATTVAFATALDPERRAIYDVEYRTIGKEDGVVRWVAAKGVGLFDESGHCVRALGTAIDISKRKAVEAELRSLNETLEQRVADRAAALDAAHEQLRQSQKMEAVGKLTGGIAHDFNNLLQVIGGNLQLLSKDVAGREKAEQRLRNALAGVSRGSKLASQLLSFGRRQPLAPKVVNLGRFTRGMDDMLRRALGEGIEIETIVSGGLWNTLVDPFQVENALLNLAINARDAMEGHGKLTIETGNALLDDDYASRHDIKRGQYVMLAVTDSGSGMAPEVMKQAFEPFFTTKPEGQGTGLGLSMVYGFVKQSSGHISIYSEPGQGTTIRIYLPRARQAEDAATDIDAGPVIGGTETILVVEDDENVRSTVVEMLSDLGYRVLKANDAQGALAIFESGIPIDFLFTDVVMPGPLRSPEMARKARERLPNLAVLFTSGYTDNAIVHGGRLDEGIELLSKPYTREQLARKVRHVLLNQRQRSGRPAPTSSSQKEIEPSVNGRSDQGQRVLLVEDDTLIRLSTADLVKNLGHLVFEAGSAQEALAILAEHPIDVLLTDVGLPGVSGVRLAAEARRRKPEIRVVFASGHDVVLGIEDAGLADAIFVLKPYSENDLVRALARP